MKANDPIKAPKVKTKTPKRPKQGKGSGQGAGQKPNLVTSLLTPQQLRKETRAATRLEYGPTQRAIRGDLRASNQRVGQVGDWWNDYLKQVSGIQGDTAAAYDRAAAQTQGFIDQSSQLDSANTQRLQAEAAQSAALRGATPDTTAAQTEAAAQAQRNYLSSAFGSATAQRGANQYAYLGDQRRIGAGQRIASMREEQKRGLSIRQDLRELAKSKGDFATKYRGELRDKDRDYLVQLKAFGLDKRNALLDARSDAADRALDAAKAAETARHNRATEANARNDGGLSPSERRDNHRSAKSAWVTAQSLYSASKRPPSTPQEWNAFVILVASEAEGADQVDAKRAVARLRKRLRSQRPQSQGPYAGASPGLGG